MFFVSRALAEKETDTMATLHTQISSLSPSYADFRDGFVEAESVEAIHLALAEVGYDGARLEVLDEAGFVRGHADGEGWSAK